VPGASGTVTGQPGIIDNPDYTYRNNKDKTTGTITYPFVTTVPNSTTQLPTAPGTIIVYDDVVDDLLDKTPGDLADEDPTGIPLTTMPTVPSPSDPTTDTPTIPPAGSEEDTDLKGLLLMKFPFCIPWDIANIFRLLNAPAAPPEWEWDPVPASVKSRFGISADTTWYINMDGMEIVGQVCRGQAR
jgi:hypothetical protein